MGARSLKWCGLCGSQNLEVVLSLGSSPPPCVMHPIGRRPTVEEHYPLELVECQHCSLVQLSVIVDPETVFAPDFPYSSGNSPQLHRNFESLALDAAAYGLNRDALVVDIGANDGTLLSKFDGCRTVGVEPTDQAKRIQGPAYQEFFTRDTARRILAEHGPAKIVTACNVLAHVEDLNGTLAGIADLLVDDGVLIAENHDLVAVLDGQWDMVYHEHLRFFSPHSFAAALEAHGLGWLWVKSTATHGGSFRMVARKGFPVAEMPRMPADHVALREQAVRTRRLIRSTVAMNRPVAIGATARGTTILNYCGLDAEDIECVCEVPTSDKLGHYIPGTSIPVVDEERLFRGDVRSALLLSWHLADVIVPKLRAKGFDRRIIVPLPSVRHLTKESPCKSGTSKLPTRTIVGASPI